MGGDKFKQNIAAWDDESIRKFLEYRHWLLTRGPANICTPATDKRVIPYAPFMSGEYPHKHLLGSLTSSKWRAIFKSPPQRLVSPNPFTLSDIRPGGMKVWDSAVGIPAADHRTSVLLNMARTPTLKDCNTHWKCNVLPALQSVGPLGPNNSIVRPKAPYLIDYTKIPGGWMYIEAAHVLAHIRGDTKRISKNPSAIPSSTAGHFQAALANITVALLYDLPLYIGAYDEGMYAMPDFEDYGIEVKSSSRFGLPFLRAPWLNKEALRFDATLAVVSVGVFVEPHPYSYNTGTMIPGKNDHWCCTPTMAMVTGWETVDVITHQPIVSANPENAYSPVCYGMHPADMMPPDLLWAYLKLGNQHLGRPATVDENHVYVNDWVNSKEFANLLSRTPPLPCKSCLSWNPRTVGVPRRPEGFPPKPSQLKKFPEWQAYYEEVKKVLGIIEPAVKRYETRFYKTRSARNNFRRLRTRNWKAKMQIIDEERLFEEACDKIRKGKRLYGRWLRVYSERRRSL